MKTQPGKTRPEGYNTLNPYIIARDVPALIEFLRRTFGGIVQQRITQPDGRIAHAEVKLGDSLLMIGPPGDGALVGRRERHRSATFYVFVPDVDSVYTQAMACGARAWAVPNETFYGDRLAAVTDIDGNVWWIATRKETLNPDQIQARADVHWHKSSAVSSTPAAVEGAGCEPNPPRGYRMVNPYVSVSDAPRFIDFVEKTFGGVLTQQIKQPDGPLEHAELSIGDSVLMIGPPQVGALMETEAHHRTGTFYVFVADVDEICDKALRHGAELLEPATDRFYGDRVAEIRDAYGNDWWIATRKEELGPKELQERADEHWQVRSRAVASTVTKGELLEFMKLHRHAVQATVTARGLPQAALVSIVVNDQLELFFDTFASTRKAKNLKRDQHVAFVIGGHAQGDERTVQYEGIVDSPAGAELQTFKEAYFALHPDAIRRSKLTGINYFRVRPRWIRYTNFNAAPAQIVVFDGIALTADHSRPGTSGTSHYAQLRTPPASDIESEPRSDASNARDITRQV